MDEKSIMDKKHGRRYSPPLYQKARDSSSTSSALSRLPSRLGVYTAAIIFAFLIVTYALPVQLPRFRPQHHPETIITQSTTVKTNLTGLVPLEAHIMSKCPDAKTCLEELVVPAMEQVVDIVNFRLSYIGSVDDNDTLRAYHSAFET